MSCPQHLDSHLEAEYIGSTAPPSPSPFVLAGHPEPLPVHMPDAGFVRHSRTASNESWELSEAPTEAPHYLLTHPGSYEPSPSRATRKWRFDPYTKDGWVPLDDDGSECSAPAPAGHYAPVPFGGDGADAGEFMTNPSCMDCLSVDYSLDGVYPHFPPTAAHEVCTMPAPANSGPAVATVQFRYGRQENFAWPCALTAESGVCVVVEGDRGEDLGRVVEVRFGDSDEGLPRVLRRARDSEVRQWDALAQEELRAVPQAQEIVDKHNVNIRVVHAEYQFDKKKLTFHFTSKAQKPQVKEALSDCFAQWRCRIWFSKTRSGPH